MDMDIDIELARAVLAAQPFSMLLGAQLAHFEKGTAELIVPVTDRLHQQHGTVHGGVLSFAADTAITFAAGTVAGDRVLTAELKINYVRPVRGEELVARATVVHAGSTLVTVRCDILDRDGDQEQLVAIAQGTIVAR